MNHDGVRSIAETESLEWKFKIVAEGFLELFDLLQRYGPVWYTEEQNNRALAVHRILQSARGASV